MRSRDLLAILAYAYRAGVQESPRGRGQLERVRKALVMAGELDIGADSLAAERLAERAIAELRRIEEDYRERARASRTA